MGLPIPSSTSDRITLVTPEDDAIITDTDESAKAFGDYIRAKVPDPETLSMKPDVEPWRRMPTFGALRRRPRSTPQP